MSCSTTDRRRSVIEDDEGDQADDDDRRRATRSPTEPPTRTMQVTEPNQPATTPEPATTGTPNPPDAARPPAPAAVAALARRPSPVRRRGGAQEGLAWLGREPEARASLLYRFLRLVARFVLFGVFRFHIDATGRERLPRGGYLLIGAAHRGWMDPFVVMHALPEQPRCWFLGSGAIDVHVPLARVADPPPRRPAAGLARRDRRREPRRGGACGHPQRRRVRPDARGDGQRAGRPDRAVPDRRRR